MTAAEAAEDKQTCGEKSSSLLQKFRIEENNWSCVHVMAVVFFYVLSYTLTTVTENQFFIDKACTANFGYNKTICGALTDSNHTLEQIEVQKYVAKFSIYNNLVKQVLPMVPGFLMAAWGDAHGARAGILIGMVGKTVYFAGYVLNARFFEWPLEYVLLTAAFPRALSGYDIGIFAAARTHISEATPPDLLTRRLAVMETINQISSPVGLPIGAAIFTASGRNYVVSFLVSAAVSTFGLAYGILFVKNIARERSNICISCGELGFTENIKRIYQKETFLRYKSLHILLIIMFLHSMIYDPSLQFLYTQLKFHWDTNMFSYFQTTEAVSGILISGLLVPVLKRRSFSDMNVLFGGVCMIIVSQVCYGTTNNQWVMYLGALASSFKILIHISVYSMASKITDLQNRGKFMVIFTTLESATCLISSPMYSNIYSATITSLPSCIFFIASVLQGLMLVLTLVLKCTLQRSDSVLDLLSENSI